MNLKTNIDKTNLMILHRNKVIPDNISSVKIGNKSVREVESVKFLGITVDRQLSWKLHINNIATKLNKQCGILYLIRDSLSVIAMKLVYYSLIYPFLSYCQTVWGASGKSKLKSIVVAQKKIIRTMTYKPRYTHTNELFRQLKLLKLDDINTFCSATFVYKSLNDYNNVEIFSYREHERYPLRNNNSLHVPLMTSKQSQTSIKYHGAKVWNQLSPDLQNKSTLSSFKMSLKHSLISKY